ncbi:MAG: endonuclease III [bacterium]|nr:endonuclease III [bacterium]
MDTTANSQQERKQRAEIIHKELERLFPGELATPLHYETDFQLLVAVILSAQCTDDRVNIVTKDLFQKYTSLDSFAHANAHDLERAIFSTGFYRNKAMAIIDSAVIIQEKYKSKVPGTMQELLQLPGVGRKTANVILGHLFKKVEGIAVDTHVIRLSNKFGLTESKNPNTIEKDLCEILPQEHWWNFSYRLKAYGRKYSPAWKKHDQDDPVSVALLQYSV